MKSEEIETLSRAANLLAGVMGSGEAVQMILGRIQEIKAPNNCGEVAGAQEIFDPKEEAHVFSKVGASISIECETDPVYEAIKRLRNAKMSHAHAAERVKSLETELKDARDVEYKFFEERTGARKALEEAVEATAQQ